MPDHSQTAEAPPISFASPSPIGSGRWNADAIGLALALALLLMLLDRVNNVFSQAQAGHAVRFLLFSLLDLAFQIGIVATLFTSILTAVHRGPSSTPLRYALLTVAVLGATIVCASLRMEYLCLSAPRNMTWDAFIPVHLLPFARRYALLGTMLAIVAEFNRRETHSLDAMHQAELDRNTLEREMTEARLQVLEAQIEPHFLFNTLANVRRLYHTDLAAGHSMLEHLMRYLEMALPRMRDHESNLSHEATLIEAYLHIQQIRMGERLRFVIDLPVELERFVVPSMMLLTLVENAIKHGINPLLEGGTIHVSARRVDRTVQLTVADDGVGFGSDTAGGGTGLANIRARLSASFGSAADFALSTNEPRGIRATLVLPYPLEDEPGARP